MKHVVTRSGKNINLTPKEFSVLELLLRSKGEVVTRTMIIEHVWDYNFDGMSNIVDVFVASLRKKVDKGFKNKLIKNCSWGWIYYMKNKSIHFKIAFWFSLFLFITTGLIFSSFYIVTSKILFQEVDKELLNHSNNPSQFNNIPGMVTTILGQNGIVKQSSISSDTPYLSYKFLYETALKKNSISYVNQNIGNTPMRFMVQPL